MSRILVSFIGKAKQEPGQDERGGYPAVHYRFPATQTETEWQSPYATSLFGAALTEYMKQINRPIDKWLVMGTKDSDWGTLSQALRSESETSERVYTAKHNLEEAQENDLFDQKQLDRWNQIIGSELDPMKCYFRITDDASDYKSQIAMWEALLEVVEDREENGDEIILDVTHAFRHMPVLASFMVNTLRQVRNVASVDLYYGGLELTKDSNTANVIYITMVRELMEISEAAATYRHTGSYEPMLEVMGFGAEPVAQEVVLADELNRHTWNDTCNLAQQLSGLIERSSSTGIASSLSPTMFKALQWADEQDQGRRLAAKARFAFDHKEYARAISLLWEGLLVTGCRIYNTGDATQHKARDDAKKCLLNDPTLVNEKKLLELVHHLRNGVVHGTHQSNRQAEQALNSLKEFKTIFDEGAKVLLDLLKRP